MKINFCILIFLVGITGACGTSGDNEEDISTDLVSNPITASADGEGQAKADIEFDDVEYDFGEIIQGEKVTHNFKFTNSGNAALIVSSVAGSCGCTVPSWSKEPIESGEDGEIKIVFDSDGKRGVQKKDITVVTNAIPNTAVIRITGNVIVPE